MYKTMVACEQFTSEQLLNLLDSILLCARRCLSSSMLHCWLLDLMLASFPFAFCLVHFTSLHKPKHHHHIISYARTCTTCKYTQHYINITILLY